MINSMACPIVVTRVLLSLLAIPAAFATDYYVSPSGNDTNSGTSPSSAWKTPANVNGRAFAAGDRILFEGGQTFSGGLSFGADDQGTAAAPITVSTYGSGRAVLNAAAASGLFAYNTAGLSISNLILTGSGAQTNTKGGIDFYNDLAGNVRLGFIRIDNVEVSGFRHGIIIGGWNGTSGFNDIRVTNSVAHDNQRSGMSTYAQARYGITNVYVGHCTFYDNFGDPALTTTPSGNGVVLGEVDGALIERTVAYNNGYLCPANSGGPVGIWVYDADNATIQHCEAYGNRTGGATDGGGFDLDINTTNSVMQYNYSHDNDGAGFGLYQGSDPAAWSNNVVRYNVSQNDGRKNSYGGITLWTGGGPFGNGEIYGNTVYAAPAATGTAHAVRINSQSANFKFRNNLLLTTGNLPLVSVAAGQTGLLFQGNDYFTYGGAFKIAWNGTDYTSLSAFRTEAGQEQAAGNPTGFSVDPLLVNAGGGPTIGFPDMLESQLTAYRLQGTSPMIDAGLDLTALFGINPGPRDYYGTPLPQGSRLDIGASEYLLAGPNQPPSILNATATPSTVTGTSASLSAPASDDHGEANLSYSWSAVTVPAGGGVSFAPNGTNAAKASTATFTAAGAYLLRVTVTDAGGLTATRDVAVTVTPALQSIVVSPASASVIVSRQQQYAASARDPFNQPLATAGTRTDTFTVTAGVGTATLRVTKR
jgi:hypothetical protein